MRVIVIILATLPLLLAADSQLIKQGKEAEQRSCTGCHSVRIIDSQRLSATVWGKELDKMARWGAVITDRKLLLDYLSQEYSDGKPVMPPALSGDGVGRQK